MWAKIKQWWSNRGPVPEPPELRMFEYRYGNEVILIIASHSSEAMRLLRETRGLRVSQDAWLVDHIAWPRPE